MTSADLYARCFPDEVKPAAIQKQPKEIFARVLKQIETMELKQYIHRDLERQHSRGCVFAIGEIGSDLVTIGCVSKTPIVNVLRRMQISNPRPLKIVSLLKRYSFDDARELYLLIKSGVTIYQCANPSWFTMENCHAKITGMFALIDKIEPEIAQYSGSLDQPEMIRS